MPQCSASASVLLLLITTVLTAPPHLLTNNPTNPTNRDCVTADWELSWN